VFVIIDQFIYTLMMQRARKSQMVPKSDQRNKWREGRPRTDHQMTQLLNYYPVWMWNSLKLVSRVQVQKVSYTSNVPKRPTFDAGYNVPVES